ncbi:LAFE_0E03752g1_1 [Lachancea fermentati]|uniref:LAFE_0E03752g1_1 n=1 Tax=Lachancea fermentati TaxID=4955 RepID=A0A1G4MCN4_LACFM|nr:LAFE_0E03752g1_1 [Lachancea fermentati]
MIPLTTLWFCAKRMPRIFALTFDFITVFLLAFVLVGCSNAKQLSTYLVSYKFNTDSPMYEIIETSFNSTQSTEGLQDVEIFAGYLGICFDNVPATISNTSILCFDRKNVSNSAFYDDLAVKVFNIRSTNSTVTKSTELNIVQLAQDMSVEIVHPYILIATIILALLMFCLILYVTLPKVPGKGPANLALLALCPIITLLWGIGAMCTHIASKSSSEFIPAASMNIIDVHKGSKAATMSWFSFSFLCIDCLILWGLYFRDRKSLSKEIDNVRKSDQNPPKYASDESSFSSRNYHYK